jgi:hypothetical protein
MSYEEASAEADAVAMEEALAKALADPREREGVLARLQEGRRQDAVEYAVYALQYAALGLRVWEMPPFSCDADDPEPDDCDVRSQKILRRMLAAGISRYDPDPLKALAAARRRKRKPAA